MTCAEIIELSPQATIAVRGDVTVGVDIVDPPFSFYPAMPSETVSVEAGVPVSGQVCSRCTAGMWECYLSDPQTEPDPVTWRTRIGCSVS